MKLRSCALRHEVLYNLAVRMAKSRKLSLMNEALTLILEENMNALVKELSRFDYAEFNRVPAGGGWTAGQIAEHLLIIDMMAVRVLSGKAVPAGRDPQDKVNAIQERLADRSNPLEAFPAVMPSEIAKEPQAMIDKLVAARKALIEYVRDHDMTLLLIERPNRIYGPMTGIEWVQFWVHHANRHLQQLAAIDG